MNPKKAVIFALVAFIAGCGGAIQPRVDLPGPSGPGIPSDGRAGSDPVTLSPTVRTGDGPMYERLCRLHPLPRGRIVIAYLEGGPECPVPAEEDETHNVALVQRYDTHPVGGSMVVCADQRVPRGWERERYREDELGCEGAKVPDGAPTAMRIFRVR